MKRLSATPSSWKPGFAEARWYDRSGFARCIASEDNAHGDRRSSEAGDGSAPRRGDRHLRRRVSATLPGVVPGPVAHFGPARARDRAPAATPKERVALPRAGPVREAAASTSSSPRNDGRRFVRRARDAQEEDRRRLSAIIRKERSSAPDQVAGVFLKRGQRVVQGHSLEAASIDEVINLLTNLNG